MLTRVYDAVVAGGGAAGIASVGALLHFKPQMKIAWVDPDFNGGRISKRYRDVSSNTKVKLFMDYANALDPFQDIIASTREPNAMSTMASLEQLKGCRLDYAANMLQMLTSGLWKHPNVSPFFGTLSHADRPDTLWSTQLSLTSGTHSPTTNTSTTTQPTITPTNTQTLIPLRTSRIILTTGSTPSTIPLPTNKPTPLDLDTCLDRHALRSLLPTTTNPTTVGIIGTSHSGIVLLMNLYELATTTHPQLRIRWFVRSNLTYAEEMDGWILRDNTGLKGASAEFARAHLEPGKLEDSDVGRYVEKVQCPDAADPKMTGELEKCAFVVQAIGFKRDGTPGLSVGGREVARLGYEEGTGRLVDEGERGKVVEGAFGAGIAFPEKVKDPYGNVEYAVGLWKFMRYLKRVVPGWVE